MKCTDAINFLDDFFDGFLSLETEKKVKDHLAQCDTCSRAFTNEKQMRHMLKTMPTPLPQSNFKEQVVKKAVAESRLRNRSRTVLSMCGGLAAAIVLWLMVFLPGPMQLDFENPESAADMTLELQQSTIIKLVINAPHDMLNSTVTVHIPQHLEVVGFPGKYEISWDTDLLKGKNLLELPVVAKKSGKSTLVTQINYQNKSKTLKLITQVPSTIQKSELAERYTG